MEPKTIFQKLGEPIKYFVLPLWKSKDDKDENYTNQKQKEEQDLNSMDKINDKNFRDIKNLVVVSNPVNYHLINANKVLESKKFDFNRNEEKKLKREKEFFEETFEKNKKKKTINSVSVSENETKGENVELSLNLKKTDQSNGYWMYPKLEELKVLKEEELKKINGFMIGREGFGQITFRKPVDLSEIMKESQKTNIDFDKLFFDKIVKIGEKFVQIYPDSDDKPAVGEGLNVKSTITLENIKPNNKMLEDEFLEFLKKQKGMKFITYSPKTYVWVFEVEHFSIWGLLDDNLKSIVDKDDSEIILDCPATKQQNSRKNKSLHFNTLISNRSSVSCIEDMDEVDSIENFESLGICKKNESECYNDVLSLDEQKKFEPTMSFYSKINFDLLLSNDWIKQLQLADDFNSFLSQHVFISQISSINDIDQILFPDFNSKSLNKVVLKIPDEITQSSSYNSFDFGNIEKIFENLIDNSTINLRANNYPKILSQEKLKFKDLIFDNMTIEDEILFNLMSIFFDKEKDLSDSNDLVDNDFIRNFERIENVRVFKNWLKKYVNNKTSLDFNQSLCKLSHVFDYICIGDLNKAIVTALSSDYIYLSSILTILDSNSEIAKKISSSQLEVWNDNHNDNDDCFYLKKIYKILLKDFDSVSENLPWNLKLSLYLFYGDENMELFEILQKVIQNLNHSDPLIDIMKFYCNYKSNTNFEPISFLKNSSLNLKHKWIFYKIFITKTGIKSDELEFLTESFGDCLFKNKFFKEAIFVYSHLECDNLSSIKIKDTVILNINITKCSNAVIPKKYLINVLKIPSVLIYEAVAIMKKNNNDYWGECKALISAKMWDEAHNSILDKLGPLTVISNLDSHKSLLNQFIKKISMSEKNIKFWDIGAEVYLKYINLSFGKNPSSLDFLLDQLPLMKNDTFIVKTALKIISKNISEFILKNYFLYEDQMKKILNLPLGKIEVQYFQNYLSNFKIL